MPRSTYNKNWKTMVCEQCSTPLKNCRQKKFCSIECSNEYSRTGESKQDVKCKTCNKLFLKRCIDIRQSPNHFCTKSCAAKYNNKVYIKRSRKPTKCKKCNKDITNETTVKTGGRGSRHLCINCHMKRFLEFRTLKEISINNGHTASTYAKVRNNAQTIINQYDIPKECRRCNYNIHADIAHIKAVSSFDENTLVSEVNDISNLIPLCKNCHWEYDRHLIPIEEIIKLNEEMINKYCK